MSTSAENLFFEQDYHGLKVIIIVPHQDDEINTAGALIPTLSESGAEIVLVYTTNGDWKYPAKTRIKEAVKAAGVLGIQEDHIIFLGYGDSINNDKHDHLFYHNQPTVSSSGHAETYGSDTHPDYFFQKSGEHHPYTNENYLSDIVGAIRDHHPDLIVCTDFDEHPDHRMLSVYLDKAVGILRKEEPSYQPELWKRFAYSTSYTAVADFSAINNPETRRPQVGVTGKYEWDLIDTSIYSWKNRIRIPVPEALRDGDLKKNMLAQALNQHKSQYIITKADRVINSDEVYWSRRTGSLTYSAEVTVSSGDGRFLNDFVLYEPEDVDVLTPDLSGHVWKPNEEDKEKKAVLRWAIPQHVERIVIYGELLNKGLSSTVRVALDDGYEKIISGIPDNGNPVVIDTGIHDGITECTVQFLETAEVGISEIEVYSSKEANSHIKPFAKITIEDNFAYDYAVNEQTRELELGLYSYGEIDTTIIVAKGKSIVSGNKLIIDPDDKEIVLQAIKTNKAVVDQVVITRNGKNQMEQLASVDKANAAYLASMRKKMKVHNMLYILGHAGIGAVVSRTIKNVVKPMLARK